MIASGLGIAAVSILMIANLALGYVQKKSRMAEAQRPLLSQQEFDEAAAMIVAREKEAQEKVIANISPIPDVPAHPPTPSPQSSVPQVDNKPAASSNTITPPTPTSRPPVVPAPTPVPTPIPTPTAAPAPPPTVQPPPSSSIYKDGDKRTNANGENEVYVEGFGWLPDSPGGTYEPIRSAGGG